MNESVNSSIGKWIKFKTIIHKCSRGIWSKIFPANWKWTFYRHINYQCFTHLKLLAHIHAGLGDWLDGISRNPRYLNEDNFKSEDNPRFLNFLILKVSEVKTKGFCERFREISRIIEKNKNACNAFYFSRWFE